MTFDPVIFAVGIFSGATASLVGFGIGSLMTPLLAARFGTELAIAAVMIPHAFATGLRCWRLRADIDRRVLLRFGVVSAAGGLLGALLYTRLSSPALGRALGLLLIFTALAQSTGWAKRWHPRGTTVTALGFFSGLFGGVAGNQGGLRAAALTAFRLPPASFVATATATGLLVDVARAPVYLWAAGSRLEALTWTIFVATAGALIGTLAGERILFGLSRERFGQIVAAAIGALGLWFLFGQPT